VSLQEETLGIIGPWQHKVLLPGRHSVLDFRREGSQMQVEVGEKRWSLPADDCVLLPVVNTTTELLAEHLVKFVLEEILEKNLCPGLRAIEVRLSESGGFSATAAIELE
jgi:6-pyruvoyltetrahydropterin/6-carboxytetrahydropterin synthase